MKADQIYQATPGTRFLLQCPKMEQEAMIEEILAARPSAFMQALNKGPVAALDLFPGPDPRTFPDLEALCEKLIFMAGYRSHFEGLLLLNVEELVAPGRYAIQLQALGELLAEEEGIASRCITVMHGVSEERTLISCANRLDFDGKLRVGCFEKKVRNREAWIAGANLRFLTAQAETILLDTLKEMDQYPEFNAGKYIRTCTNARGYLTERAIQATLKDPYSYINRVKKTSQAKEPCKRKIGFWDDPC